MFPKDQKVETDESQEDVVKDDKKKEASQLKKTKRSREDVKSLFKKSYLEKHGIDLKDPKVVESGIDKKLDAVLDDLTDRELANSRNMSKVIGQKIKYRDNNQSKPLVKKEKENENEDEDEEGEINDMKSFRDNERAKAIGKFLPKVVKEFKDEKLDPREVYKKMDKYYAEENADTRREDFTKNLEAAFRAAYPDLHDERKEREKAKETEEDTPIIGGGGHHKNKKKKVSKSDDLARRGSRRINLPDWFKGKD